MYNLSNAVLNISLVIATIWIVFNFFGTFYERKKLGVLSIISLFVYGIFQLYVQFNAGSASVYTTIINILFVLLLLFMNFYVLGKKTLFVIFSFHAIWVLIEMFVFFCMVFFKVPNDVSNIVGAVISKIIMLIGTYFVSGIWKKKDMGFIPIKYYLPILFLPVGSIYIAIKIFFLLDLDVYIIQAIIIISLLLLFNIVIFEIYSKLTQFYAFEKEKTVYAQQLNIISRSTEEQKRMMTEFYEEKHNLVNELIVLRNGIENGDKTAVMNNLNRIINSYDIKERISNSGNNIVDTLLNFKYATAKEKGIQFLLKIFIPDEIPIDQCDVGVVVGNAIDNAIDAVEQCNVCSKIIKIVMGVKKETFVMVIENPYEHKIRTDKRGSLLSTKEDSNRHGYGVSSIKRIVEKYNGEVIINTDNNIFSLTVTMGL